MPEFDDDNLVDDGNDIYDRPSSKVFTGAEDESDAEELNMGGAIPYRYEKRPARLDITRSSKDDHRYPMRFTRKELETQLRKDYKYMRQKPYMMLQPFMIMRDYPFKKSSNDNDVPDKNNSNVDFGLMLVLGRLPRFRSIEEYKNEKTYVMGDAMYVKAGTYYLPDTKETLVLKPHIALVIKKRREKKKIRPIDVRELFDCIKNELQNGKPYVVYKEMPVIQKLAE